MGLYILQQVVTVCVILRGFYFDSAEKEVPLLILKLQKHPKLFNRQQYWRIETEWEQKGQEEKLTVNWK